MKKRTIRENWGKGVAIYVVITLLAVVSTGIIFYHVSFEKSAPQIESAATQMTDTSNKIREVTDFTLTCLNENKQWRIEEMPFDRDKQEEFATLIESCIMHKECEDIVDYEIDYSDTQCINAKIISKNQFDYITSYPQTVLRISFDYELIERKDITYTGEQFKAIAYDTLLSNAIAVSIVLALAILAITSVCIILCFLFKVHKARMKP